MVGRFVEFFGPGLDCLSVSDRATIANMAPEYGATCGFFPVDERTLDYLAASGRDPITSQLVGDYCRRQGLFRDPGEETPEYTRVVDFDIGEVLPSVAGPRRPQDLILLTDVATNFRDAVPALASSVGRADTALCAAEVCLLGETEETVERFEGEGGAAPGQAVAGADVVPRPTEQEILDNTFTLTDGTVVIAAITSCTNTSNPSVMIAAALLARNAVNRGLKVSPWVKTSTAPGSRAVTAYLERSGLLPYLEALGFNIVGYGCTTCIGNSGPLPAPIVDAIENEGLITTSVLSGNRNFEARVHPLVRSNYLASPPLVVAYALAGSVDGGSHRATLGIRSRRRPRISGRYMAVGGRGGAGRGPIGPPRTVQGELQERRRGGRRLEGPRRPGRGSLRLGPRLHLCARASLPGRSPQRSRLPSLISSGARILGIFGDSVTTDHISPAGVIAVDSPAGRYLEENGVRPLNFNTYGSRRGNHEVLVRGTFANVRIRNLMLENIRGGWTVHEPSGEVLTIFDAAERYRSEGTPLVVLAGKEYGTGSSRDWAAKGPALLGVRAVIAESFERIHRSNLVGMGILPLQFEAGHSAAALGLTGGETLGHHRHLRRGPRFPGAESRCGRCPGSVKWYSQLSCGLIRQSMPPTTGTGASSRASSASSWKAAMRQPEVRLLHTDGCAAENTEAARAALGAALIRVGLPADAYEVVLIRRRRRPWPMVSWEGPPSWWTAWMRTPRSAT